MDLRSVKKDPFDTYNSKKKLKVVLLDYQPVHPLFHSCLSIHVECYFNLQI